VTVTDLPAGLIDALDTGFQPAPGHHLAEQITIGAAQDSRERAEEIAEIVEPEYFYTPAHQLIFAAIMRVLADSGAPVGPDTVLAELARAGTIQAAGGGPYLHSCYKVGWPQAASGGWYARKVLADFRRRKLWQSGVRIVTHTAQHSFDPADGFELARGWVDDATAEIATTSVQPLGDLAGEVLYGLENQEITGLSSPWADLNERLNPLEPGTMTVVAARPAMGKSVVGLNWATHIAVDLAQPVLFSSLEMRRKPLMLRMYAAEARVELDKLIAGKISDNETRRLFDAKEKFEAGPLVIDDTPVQSLGHVRTQLRAMRRTGPAVAWVADYLSLFKEPPGAENRQVAVARLSTEIRNISREFEIPAIILHQLNRGPEHRPDKRPQVSDLRESGQIEQDADNILLLHRDDATNPESERAGEIDVIIGKQRQGPLATVTLVFQGHYARCMDMAWTPSTALKAS
jgi:replicative DNA helicase